MNNTFENCRNLTSVTIGSSVTSIGNSAFYRCRSLTSIDIPNSVTSIGFDAFWDCRSLTSITIGSSVTSIGNSAFYGCSSLTEVINHATTPQAINAGTFQNVPVSVIPLYVPSGSVEAYKAAAFWQDFFVKSLDEYGKIPVASVSLNKSSISLAIEAAETLIAIIEPDDAYNKEITWTSSHPAIAAVDDQGKVTGISAGEAVITVTTQDGNHTATCTVTVTALVVCTHNWIEHIIKAATCAEAGEGYYVCSLCDAEGAALDLPALGHSWINANCTTPKTCSVCSATEGAALGHSWGAWTETIPATCELAGEETRTCTNNADHKETREIPKLTEGCGATSTEQILASNLKIYPNPTDGAITIEFETAGERHLTISDMSGRILHRQTANDQSVRIDLSGYASGAYLLTIENGEGKRTVRIIKN
jgi:hypothetical protein